MKAFLSIDGSGAPVCSASRYGSTCAFGGSSSVIALNCKFVFAGHNPRISCDAWVISLAVIGDRGWEISCLAGTAAGAEVSVCKDMLSDAQMIANMLK